MKFTISIQLPTGVTLASDIVLDDAAWQERGFHPIPMVQEATLLADSQRNSAHRMQRRHAVNLLMERLGKRALKILAHQDGANHES
jgi:hypothetical protein